MIIKVKTLVFCENFMGTETFTQWHFYTRKINLSGNLLIFIYLFSVDYFCFVHDCYSLLLLTQI